MDQETKTRRFYRACRGEHCAMMRLYYASEEKKLSREEVDRYLFWIDAWQKAANYYHTDF